MLLNVTNSNNRNGRIYTSNVNVNRSVNYNVNSKANRSDVTVRLPCFVITQRQ